MAITPNGGCMSNNKSVYVAYTGGTIGMVPGTDGFRPEPGYLTEKLIQIASSYQGQLPEIEVNEYQPLLDSANMSPTQWEQIAEDIETNYKKFDGFVILHGTDTMAYSASALSFMLEELSKPVIFTGSQIPLGQIRSDAMDNIIGALMIAGNYKIPEVAIYFHNHLYRGNRCQKMDASGFDAFASPNFPPLAQIGTDIDINKEVINQFPRNPFKIQRINPPKIITMNIFPGFDASIISVLSQQNIDGIILRTYGIGNAPVQNQELLEALKLAHDKGIVIVNCTQCFQGYVDMKSYETGMALTRVGVVSGNDMTVEAALTKLYYLFSIGLQQAQIEEMITTNLRGELTPRNH